MEELLNGPAAKLVIELGFAGTVLFLYVRSQLIDGPKRDASHAGTIKELMDQFRGERKEDREHMERITDKLAASIDKLSAELDEMRRDANSRDK